MSQEMTSAYQTTASQDRKGVVLFSAGAVIMVTMMLLGYSIEDELTAYGMKVLEERHDPIMGLVFLFAFGFPLGIVTTLAGGLIMSKTPVFRVAVIATGALGLVSLAALVPAVFGRELSGAYFGSGGITILIAMVVSFWYWAQYRAGLREAVRNAADIKALGYLCFGLAAWNTCGLASLPSFGLDPQTMIAQGMQPFAIGQAKAVMAYFVLGWLFTAVGLYKSAMSHQE